MFLMDKLRPLQLRLILKEIWQYRSQNNKILAETSVNLACLIITQIVSIWNIKILCYHASHALFFLRRVTWRKAMILMFKTKRLHRFPLGQVQHQVTLCFRDPIRLCQLSLLRNQSWQHHLFLSHVQRQFKWPYGAETLGFVYANVHSWWTSPG